MQADDGEKNYTVNGNIWTHKQATPAGSEFQYRVRVKYVGDVGAQSGEIKVTFPIPDDVRVLTDAELNAIGAETKLVQAGSVKETEVRILVISWAAVWWKQNTIPLQKH